MQASIRNIGEYAAAVTVIALGAFLIWEGSGYEVGSAGRMGPGFFPVSLGCLLSAIGLALLFAPAEPNADEAALKIQPILFVLASILAFAWIAPRFGLVAATIILVIISSLAARPGVNLLYVAVLAILLPSIGYFLFVRGLGVPLSAFG